MQIIINPVYSLYNSMYFLRKNCHKPQIYPLDFPTSALDCRSNQYARICEFDVRRGRVEHFRQSAALLAYESGNDLDWNSGPM